MKEMAFRFKDRVAYERDILTIVNNHFLHAPALNGLNLLALKNWNELLAPYENGDHLMEVVNELEEIAMELEAIAQESTSPFQGIGQNKVDKLIGHKKKLLGML